MALNAYQTVSVTCPNCQHRFAAPILTIIDASANPEAKALFLSGQINIAGCPQCGRAGMLSTPLVYHDAGKEMLLTFAPQEMGLSELEQQRILGDMTNRLISALPAAQRKGYLLRPRNFYRLEGMMEAILEADGVTREMLDAQRARASLLERLLVASNEDVRRTIAQENDAQIDYDFFQLLALNLELAQARGASPAEQQLLYLQEQLLDWTTQGKEIRAREEAIRSLGDDITREGLLEKLIEAAGAGEQVKIDTMVTVARPAIDYLFYLQLTERIESAAREGKHKEADTLKSLRETVLDVTEEIDAEMRLATEEATQFLQQLLASDDPDAGIRANPERVDDLFVSVLGTSLQSAERAGQAEVVARLNRIRDAVMQLVQESQPPEIQFINQLMTAEYPEGTRALLEENREDVNERLLEMMSVISQDLDSRGRKGTAERLNQIREQAVRMAGSTRL